jgi:hypothetical protein
LRKVLLTLVTMSIRLATTLLALEVACLAALSIRSSAADSIVVFNEIHYHPAKNDHSKEFIELFNQNTVDVDMSGWRLSGGVDFAFPEGTIIEGRSLLVVAADPALIEGALGPLEGRLDNGSETLRLRNRNDRVMDEVSYNDRRLWPVAADGSGATLAKWKPFTASAPPDNWTASPQIGGTPGRENFLSENAARPTVSMPLLEFGAEWRYNESGQDLGPQWSLIEHSPGGDWKTGPGPLGFETNPARLPVPLGTTISRPITNSPFVVTHYFETDFLLTVAQVAAVQALEMSHSIDDGAVFFINGAEALRFNMPSGELDASTLAVTSREADLEGPIELPTVGLAAGRNRISVEVHQRSVGNSDIVMGLELGLKLLLPDPNSLPIIRISEVPSARDDSWWVELANYDADPIELGGFVVALAGGREHVLPPVTIGAGAQLVVPAEQLGFEADDEDRLFLYTPEKTGVLDAVVVKNRPRARESDDPDGRLYTPSASTPGEANSLRFRDEIVINEIMYHHRPQYAQAGDPPELQSRTLVGFDATWRYNESGIDPGPGWAAVNDPIGGAWQSGVGALGVETNLARLPVGLGTVLTRPADNSPYVVTYYFETDFEMTSAEMDAVSDLEITHAIDDGAIFYLNGQEVGRFGMNDGIVTADTLAADGREAELNTLAVDPSFLLIGTNRISVEVHQARIGNSDIVMGLKLDAVTELPGENPPRPHAAIDKEWIELYNRSDREVDLSGWNLEEAVQFEFPGGTKIGAGEYLVLANDAAGLAAKFPGARIVGDFSGRLSNQSERIRLIDAVGNPADTVHYVDYEPWPPFTDGGGSSLELRNPHADNSVAEAWAASDNSTSSEWKSYSFTATAKTPRFGAATASFRELRVGLLDRGEVLIDDVSVIEDPGGANRELIQNGGFNGGDTADAADWRLLGTHRHLHVVEGDGSPALKVVAKARMNYVHNLIETSLKNGGALVSVRDGTDYRISFRAKWLSGSPQLRMELYYNKIAGLTILHQPETHGTPGARNSVVEDNLGPAFNNVQHSPAVPQPNQPIRISGDISDPDGVASVRLHYSLNGEAFQIATMTRLGASGERWQGQIAGQPAGRAVQFYLEASDGSQATFYPPAGPDSRAMFRVDDGRASDIRQNLRVVMTSSDSTAMHRFEDMMSNDRYGCTIIYNESEIFYDCGVRMRGSMWSRNAPNATGLNYRFPADRLFRGVHKTITTRRRNVQEVIPKHIINHAGGLHDDYNDIIQLMHSRQNGVATRLSMARFGDVYLDGLPGGSGSEGHVFKMDGAVGAINTTNGTPEGIKLFQPVNWNSSFDIGDQGADKEQYRLNMRLSNNFSVDDFSSLIAMCKSFDLRGDELEAAVKRTINVDKWMRQFALMSLLGVGDSYTHGSPHNLLFYAQPSDGIIESMPWDWDFLYTRPFNAPLWGNRNMSRVISRPAFTRLFHGHLLDLIDTTVNPDYMSRWLSHYGQVAGENYSGHLGNIRQRVNYIMGRLPAEIPFAITSNSGRDFETESSSVSLSGSGWINVRAITLDGSDEPLHLQWTDDEHWQAMVLLMPGVNTFTIRAFDNQSREVGSDTITITNTGTLAAASSRNLTITELMYHPAEDSGLEFIELINTSGTATIDLTGVRFTEGIDYGFPANTHLPPGEQIVVRESQFVNNTRLANSGERLRLLDASGSTIFDFRYRDNNPWPESADGVGYSLVRSDFSEGTDLNDPLTWRPSVAAGGNPGSKDSEPSLGEALLQEVLATSLETVQTPTGGIAISYQRYLASDDIALTWQASDDLQTWDDTATMALHTRTHNSDGTETLVFRTQGGDGQFLRLRANLRPIP